MYLRSPLDRFARTAFAAICAAVLLGACAETAIVDAPQFVTRERRADIDRIYRLSIGDKLKVTVFGEENLSGEFEVNAVGQISMPLIGELNAKSLTLQEFRDLLVRKLSDGYLKNPKVTAQILNYRPIYVHGEVKNGGEFQYKNGLSLRDAVAMAGGYTYRADQSYLYIGREGEPELAVKTLSDLRVLPGDNIRIPERFF